MIRFLGLLLAACVFGFVGWIGFHQYNLNMASKDDYAEAEARIEALIENGQLNHLDLSDLDALRVLPEEISALNWLEHLNLSNTNITDLSPLSVLENLEYLSVNQMPVTDLTPLAQLSALHTLSLHRSWAFDLSPLRELRNLEDLNLAYTAVQSLESLTRLRRMKQLTLYSSYAHDGSQSHYESLLKTVVRVNNGNAYKQNYKPDQIYRARIDFQRLIEKWTLGGPPKLE